MFDGLLESGRLCWYVVFVIVLCLTRRELQTSQSLYHHIYLLSLLLHTAYASFEYEWSLDLSYLLYHADLFVYGALV